MKFFFNLRPADAVTALFLVCLLLVSLAFYEKIPEVKTLVLIYTVLLLFQVVIIKTGKLLSRNKAYDMALNVVFPVACVLIVFDSLGLLVHYINPKDIDPLLIRLDYLIFRGYPTVMLESVQSPLLTDVLQLAYSSYYFLAVSLGLLLKLQGREWEFDKTVFFILLCFYLSYVGYLLFPALGPRYAMDHLHSTELTGLLVAEPIQRILNSLEGIKRDAFPSGHTGIVLVVSGLAYRFHKGFFYGTLPVILLLIFSTVYLRYHYTVDVIGGVLLAALTFFIGGKYYDQREKRISSYN
ncbi:MAG TPA: phosphatase PAP2 family protein [Thermodesulfovibrionales bacterium]|nr:phosphatase PAP2 family protein [Thermodesulfovibrionales bacterium]